MSTDTLVLLGTSSGVGGYIYAAVLVYRKHYRATFRAYRKWQQEAPTGRVYVDDDGRFEPRPRRSVSYNAWFTATGVHVLRPSWEAIFWLPIVMFRAGAKVLRPEVEVPDYVKIHELEKLRDE